MHACEGMRVGPGRHFFREEIIGGILHFFLQEPAFIVIILPKSIDSFGAYRIRDSYLTKPTKLTIRWVV